MGAGTEITLPAGFVSALARARSQHDVLAVTADWMPRVMQVERASVALPVDDRHLTVHAIGGAAIVQSADGLSIQTSMVGRAFRLREVVVVDDLLDCEETEIEALIEAGLRSAIAGPMVSGGRCLGTINLSSTQVAYFTDHHVRLLNSVADLIASFFNVHLLVEEEQARAATDDLTGALSRKAILRKLEAGYQPGGSKPSVLYLDLNGFKVINDSHGHQVGDAVLRVVADRIRPLLGPADLFGRVGGDEFVVLVDEGDHRPGQRRRSVVVANQIRDRCRGPVAIGPVQVHPRMSIGVAHPHDDSALPAEAAADQLLADADRAMYLAKQRQVDDGTSSGVVVVDESLRREASMVTTIDRSLDAAIANNELCFHYQPVRQLMSGEIMGAEALIRWHHPVHGWIPAPLLIERIAATGHLDRFTEWCLDRAASDLDQLRQAVPGFHDKAFSLNMTPRQLSWPGYSACFHDTLARYRLRPQDLIIEVLESTEIGPDEPAERTLQTLSNAGAIIALDDFGVGHNSLGYLPRFPVQAIKYDRSLVVSMATNPVATKVVRSLTKLAAELGMYALAEGIELEEQREMCRKVGITHGQGWLLGHPRPLDVFIRKAGFELTHRSPSEETASVGISQPS